MNKIRLKLVSLYLLLLTTIPLAKLEHTSYIQPATDKDIHCLAQNIYHEARSEAIAGQIAVAQVTVNRVKQSNFTKTVCEVVFQKNQFSWTNNKRLRVKDLKAWDASLVIAKAVLTNSVRIPNFTATHYHTKQVNPRWNRKMELIAIIGVHKFFV